MSRATTTGLATLATLAAGAFIGGTWVPAAADEVRQVLNAPMILQMLSKPAEKPEAALREMLRPDAPRPMRVDQGQVMPDGSVRYGSESTNLTMTIRNPCPPGDFEHEVMAQRSLPGRARK